MKTKWKNIENLSGKYLLLLPGLLQCKVYGRCKVDVRFMIKSEDVYIFTFHKLHKVGESAKHHQNYTFKSTQKNCVWCLP